jgi:hypothetical protein
MSDRDRTCRYVVAARHIASRRAFPACARVLRPPLRVDRVEATKKRNEGNDTSASVKFCVPNLSRAKRFVFDFASTHEITPLRAPTHPHLTYHFSSLKMAITYDKAMQVYFGMYAATMTTFPDEYVPPPFRPDRGRRNSRNQPEIERAFSRTRPRRRRRRPARATDRRTPRLLRFPCRVWGKDGLGQLPYWAKPLGDALAPAGFFARIVGMCFGLLVFGRLKCGVSEDAFSKQTIAFHVVSLLPFGNIALNPTANWTQWVWQLQVVINVLLALWGAQSTGLLGGGKKKAKRSTRKRA